MKPKDERITDYINDLINNLHKTASYYYRQQIHSYSRKIFGVIIGKPIQETGPEMKEKVLAKVSNNHDQRALLQCQEITQRFLNCNTVHRKAEVLKMLLKYSELNGPVNDNMGNIFKDVKKRETQYTGKQLSMTVETVANQSVNVGNQSTNVIRGKHMFVSEQQLRMIRNKGSEQLGLSQIDLLKQLTYTFNNASSQVIIFENDRYKLRNDIPAPEAVRNYILQIGQLGWLHKKIKNMVVDQGSIRKALKMAVDLELNQYYHWIGVVQNQINAKELTFRKLTRWSYEPLVSLSWLAIIIQAVEPFQGCRIISIINSYRPHGSQIINQLLNRLLSQLIKPLMHYIYNWTYKGILLDSNGQFFIGENKKVDEWDEWQNKYVVISKNIPNILDRKSVDMIFNIGRTIYFLRKQCNYSYTLQIPFINTKNIMNNQMGFSTSLLSANFTSWLNSINQQANQTLVKVLMNDFHLKYHLESMKNFFLMGKGDFIQHLFDSLKDQLYKSKHQITEHSLDGYISDAITKCFGDQRVKNESKISEKGKSYLQINFYRNHVADRLLAKKIEYGSGNDGWDSFNFKYSIQKIQPIQTLISPDNTINYQKIFHFLWKIKQIQDCLKNIWISQSKEYPLLFRGSELHQLFQPCYLLRNTMTHFLSNFYSYLMITVEASWKKFWQQIDNAKSFEEIIKQHRKFIEQVLEITLNTSKFKQINLALNNVFTVITSFRSLSLNLQSQFETYYESRRLYEQRLQMIRRGVIEEKLELPSFSNHDKLKKSIANIKSLYNNAFKNFYLQIRKQNENRLNVLCFRLDFSEYYTQMLNE